MYEPKGLKGALHRRNGPHVFVDQSPPARGLPAGWAQRVYIISPLRKAAESGEATGMAALQLGD